MRVIAGSLRSRPLIAPAGTATRPTSDRLRETLFNILGPRVTGSRFADLYSGTGAVGIEAISRGAAHVWFAENGPPALKALRANLTKLKINGDFTLEDRGTAALFRSLAKKPPALNLVYIDPPYEAEAEYTATLNALARGDLLAPGALVLAEHATKGFHPADRYGTLERTRLYKQGDTTVSFYAAPAAETESDRPPAHS